MFGALRTNRWTGCPHVMNILLLLLSEFFFYPRLGPLDFGAGINNNNNINNDILLRIRGPYHRHKSTKSG